MVFSRLLGVAGLCALLALLGVFWAFPAAAASYPDQGFAYSACRADMAAIASDSRFHSYVSGQDCTQASVTSYYCRANNRSSGSSVSCRWFLTGVTDDRYFWSSGSSCSARSPLTGGLALVGGAGTSCTDGCVYGIGGGGIAVTIGDKTYGSLDGATATGAVCSGQVMPSVPESGDCQQIGSLTQCVKPDGRHCAKASTGREFCWQPGEAGTKTAGNEAATKAPEGAGINAPINAPPNGGDWQQKGSGTVSTSSGGTVNNYTITTWQSSYGSQGDGTPDGTGGEGEDGPGGPSASGGASCDMGSFQCSDMSSVECNQLVQTWYLRCKGVDLTGGETCDAPPVCQGNAADCYISSTLWRMRCDGIGAGDGSSDAVGNGAAEIVSGEGDGSEEPDLSGLSEGMPDEADGVWIEKSQGSLMGQLGDLDSSGFISSRSCPPAGSFSVGGKAFELSYVPICTLLEQASVLVMALAYWLAFRIITKPQWS